MQECTSSKWNPETLEAFGNLEVPEVVKGVIPYIQWSHNLKLFTEMYALRYHMWQAYTIKPQQQKEVVGLLKGRVGGLI